MKRVPRRRGLRTVGVALVVAACGSASSRPSPTGDSTPDAGTDSPIPTESGSPPPPVSTSWCRGRSETFCDDFDTPALTSKAWTINDTRGTTRVGLPPDSLDTVNHTSAPNAFVARTPAMASGGVEILEIQGGSAAPEGKSHVDADFAFSVRIGALGGASKVEIARVEGVNPITFASYGLALVVGASGASLELKQGARATVALPLAAAPTTGSWTRVTIHLGMEVVVNGPPTPITIQIGAAPAETFSLDRGMGVRPFYRLGLRVSGPSGPCEVTYDDVTYDAR